MKFVKGWEEEEDDYALFASPAKKKGQKKQFKGRFGYCGEIGHKAANCPDKKARKKRALKTNLTNKRHSNLKRMAKERAKEICQKYNCGEMGHFARDCPKSRENADIARESEQNRNF